jgi:FkbM family methyltransferase
VLNLRRKLSSYAESVRTLRQARVRYRSICLYPIRRRGRNARCEVELENGLSLVSGPDEPFISLIKEIFVDDCYRLAELQLRPGEVIVDIGANVGTFAVAVARMFPQAPVICVEPEASAYAFLAKNVKGNHLSEVETINAACGGSSGEQVLYARRLHMRSPTAWSTLYETDNYGSAFAPLDKVPVFSLDRLFSMYEIDACGLLKLDCEGAEYEILVNASPDVLSRIRRISMEYHLGLTDHTPDELGSWLESCGFAIEGQAPFDEEGGYLYAWRESSA